MKLKKTLLFTALALCSLPAGQALAYDYYCSLKVNSVQNPVAVGQPFGFSVRLSFVDFGPPPPISIKPYAVVFHGTKNGIPDTGSGQHLINIAGNYTEQLNTYNPGGMTGYYIRYAKIYLNGQLLCTTNSVSLSLL